MTDVLDPDELAARLTDLHGWEVVDGRLHRELRFADFSEAFAFMTRVALVAEAMQHHPDWSNSWNRVVIDVVSHDAGGITDGCVELAARVNQILDA